MTDRDQLEIRPMRREDWTRVEASEEAGYWTLEAGILPENEASLRLFEKCGFRRVGVRESLGMQGDEWRDVVLMERRSDTVGAK